MSKFKVGDKVIRTGRSVAQVDRGSVYLVTETDEGVYGNAFAIKVDDSVGWYRGEYFSLAETAPIGDPDDSPVEHPKHYNSDPSGVECITIVRHRNFNIGNAFKYLWRLGLKGVNAGTKEKQVEEIDKAIFYLQDERARILA